MSDSDQEQTNSLAAVSCCPLLLLVLTVHENQRSVLIHRSLRIFNERHILNDDDMIGMLAGRIQEVIGSHHIIDHIRFGDLLRAELLRRREILAIVVS